MTLYNLMLEVNDVLQQEGRTGLPTLPIQTSRVELSVAVSSSNPLSPMQHVYD